MIVFVSLNEDGTKVNGIFNMPQNDPLPDGYAGEMDDSDPRIVEFLNLPIPPAPVSS
jgi:hypothetical protein